MTTEITEQELADARQIWGDALIAISKAFEEKGIDAARWLLTTRWTQPMALSLGRFYLSQL